MNITVLYVDDEEINLFIFERAFKNIYNVITAISGEEGLRKLDAHSNDIIVVISDMRMPGMNGIEFIRSAKNKYSNIAYYILTAFDYNEEIKQAIDENLINKFFTKPFDIEAIKTSVENVVKDLNQ
jgi:response regulator RpfG family c-di-GMP phosphodiesterase